MMVSAVAMLGKFVDSLKMNSSSRFGKAAGKSSAAFPLNAQLLNSGRPHVIPLLHWIIDDLQPYASHKHVHFDLPSYHFLESVSLKKKVIKFMFSLYSQMNLSPNLRGSDPFVRDMLLTHILSPATIFQFSIVSFGLLPWTCENFVPYLSNPMSTLYHV